MFFSYFDKLNCFFFGLAGNLNIKFHTKTKLYTKNNHTFYNVTGCRGKKNTQTSKKSSKLIKFFLPVQFTMENLKLRMDNLFEGVKVLGEKNVSIIERFERIIK